MQTKVKGKTEKQMTTKVICESRQKSQVAILEKTHGLAYDSKPYRLTVVKYYREADPAFDELLSVAPKSHRNTLQQQFADYKKK